MAKITLPTIASGFASNTEFNTAFDAIEAELQNKVLYRNNTSGETNTMSNALDMNSNAITNASSVTTTALVVGGTDLSASVTAAGASATAAATSASAASTSAGAAATSATNAAAAAAGIKWKEPVFAATTANLDLNGTETIDGVSVTAEKRVLVKNQTLQENNGIYVCKAGAWERADKANTFVELPSAAVIVEEGSVNKDQIFICTTNNSTTAALGGTDAEDDIIWAVFGVVTATTSSGLTVSGNAITMDTEKVSAGSDTTIAAADVLVFGDTSDSNSLKRDTVQGVLDLITGMSVANGGTGATSLTDGTILLGNGTSAVATLDLDSGEIAVGASGTGNPTAESLVDTNRTWTKAQRGEVTSITSATNVTIDMAVSNNFTITLGHSSVTFENTTNNTAGQSGSIFLVQDGSGGRTATFASDWDFPGGTAPVLSTAVNSVDRLDYIIKGADDIHCIVTKAYT